jgi:hypothetical protein
MACVFNAGGAMVTSFRQARMPERQQQCERAGGNVAATAGDMAGRREAAIVGVGDDRRRQPAACRSAAEPSLEALSTTITWPRR